MNLNETIDPNDALEPLEEAAVPAAVPARLGPYHLTERIGAGAMGVVYKGWDKQLTRNVAVKMLWPKLAADAEARERFLREARAAAALSHPNVTQIYFIGEEQGLVFFAMEYLEGSSLQDLLSEERKLSPGTALALARQAASGLRAAADRGIIHRDVKPSNLVLTSEGTLKVTDFGLAKHVMSDAGLTTAGQLLGTPNYMSPEQASGGVADVRSDIYSLGATFFELVTGRPPYQGPTAMAVIMKQVSEPVPSLRQIEPGLSYALAGLIQRMLAKKPEGRPQTYDSLIEEMDRLAPTLGPVGALRVRTVAGALVAVPAAGNAATGYATKRIHSSEARATAQRGGGTAPPQPADAGVRTPALALFLAALVVLGFAGLWMVVQGPGVTPPDNAPGSSAAVNAGRHGRAPAQTPPSVKVDVGAAKLRPMPDSTGVETAFGGGLLGVARGDLQIVEKSHEITADGRLRVLGRVSNVGAGRASGGRIRVLLSDDEGGAIDSAEVPISPAVLGPGETGTYEAFFKDPGRSVHIQLELNWVS